MKGLIFGSLLVLSLNVLALDGRTNPPDKGSSQDTTIMGGGTPGTENSENVESAKSLEEQEERKQQKDKIDKEDITDQNQSLDSI